MLKALTASLVSAGVALASLPPAEAMPTAFIGVGVTSPVQHVDHRPGHGRPGYWNGHRGSRHYRPGYRRHNDGWWYPLAVFGLGAAIIGSMANQPRLGVAMPSAHVRWCLNRYRSYDTYSNTFQPYHGPRQVCVSPYWR